MLIKKKKMNKKIIIGIFLLLMLIIISFSVAAAGAVRVLDPFPTQCGPNGWVAIGYSQVLINGLPAVRLGDTVAVGGLILGGSVMTGSSSVLIGGMPAARFNDLVTGMCLDPILGVPIPFAGYFILASPNVFIG